jgi:hypothetical protein
MESYWKLNSSILGDDPFLSSLQEVGRGEKGGDCERGLREAINGWRAKLIPHFQQRGDKPETSFPASCGFWPRSSLCLRLWQLFSPAWQVAFSGGPRGVVGLAGAALREAAGRVGSLGHHHKKPGSTVQADVTRWRQMVLLLPTWLAFWLGRAPATVWPAIWGEGSKPLLPSLR